MTNINQCVPNDGDNDYILQVYTIALKRRGGYQSNYYSIHGIRPNVAG